MNKPSESIETQVKLTTELRKLLKAGAYRQCAEQAAIHATKWPRFAPLQIVRGRALELLGDPAGALESYRTGLVLKPDDVHAARGIASSLRSLGRSTEVIPTLAELYYEQPSQGLGTALLHAAFDATDDQSDLMEMMLRDFYPRYFDLHQECQTVLSDYVPFEAWCMDHGIAVETLDAGGEIRLTGVEGAPVQPYEAPAVKFSTVPGARVIAGLDWVLGPAGEFLDGSGLQLFSQLTGLRYGGTSFVPFAPDPRQSRVLHARRPGEVDVDEDVLFLSADPNHHFGHWLIDYLPRLMGWRRDGARRQKLFCLANLPKPQRETLAHFGVQAADLLEAPCDGTMYRFRSITALHVGDTQRPVPSLAKFLHNGLAIADQRLAHGSPARGFFLERSQTKRGRDIANQDEFRGVLEDFAIETVRRPELTVAEQDARFSEAAIIITPFGSDQYTIFQARPDTDFIVLVFKDMEEIYPGIEQIMPRYCAILGMRYHAVECALAPRAGKIAYHGDMVVDCDALRRTLAAIAARRAAAA